MKILNFLGDLRSPTPWQNSAVFFADFLAIATAMKIGLTWS